MADPIAARTKAVLLFQVSLRAAIILSFSYHIMERTQLHTVNYCKLIQGQVKGVIIGGDFL